MDELPNVTALTEESSSSMLMTTLHTTAATLHLTSTAPRHNDDGKVTTDDITAAFRNFVILPLTSFGLAGNVLSLWVWSAETAYNSTVFMLKMLAFWDSVLCAAHLVFALAKLSTQQVPLFFFHTCIIFVLISQISSVYTTLLSSATRLLAIFRPAHFNTILSRPRVIALCVAILVWSVLLSLFEAFLYVCWLVNGRAGCQYILDIVNFYRKNYFFDLLAFCIPIFLLLACNALIVWKFSQHRKEVNGASSNQGQGDKTRRLSITMVTISVTSLLSYPVAVSVRLGLNPGQAETDLCDIICYYIVANFCSVLTTFNSCINVVYYFVISSRFRELFSFQVSKCCQRYRKKK